MVLPKMEADRCERHRRTRVTGIGFLHGVHGQRADGVDGVGVEIGRGLRGGLRHERRLLCVGRAEARGAPQRQPGPSSKCSAMTTGASPKSSEARAATRAARLMTDDYDIN